MTWGVGGAFLIAPVDVLSCFEWWRRINLFCKGYYEGCRVDWDLCGGGLILFFWFLVFGFWLLFFVRHSLKV